MSKGMEYFLMENILEAWEVEIQGESYRIGIVKSNRCTTEA